MGKPRLPSTIRCANEKCGEEFKPRCRTSKYCCRECQIESRRLHGKVIEKRCPKCGKTKMSKDFNKQRSASSGLSSYCRGCNIERRKEARKVISYICEVCKKQNKRVSMSPRAESKRRRVCLDCAKKITLSKNDGRPWNYSGTKYFSGRAYSAWKASAKRRGYKWKINKDQLVKICEGQNGKCALSGISFDLENSGSPFRPSIDRIDSKGCYELGNIQFVCSVINVMKNKIVEEEFIELCERVVKTRKKRRKNDRRRI